MTELDFPNIQGFVVRGYRLPAAGYLFLRIEDAAKARAFLGDVIPQVITAERWDVKPNSGINLAFSYEGLRALGVSDSSLAGFPAEFREGMASRAGLLGDVGESAPEHWEECFRSGDAHVLVMISAKDPEALAERDRGIRGLVERDGGASVVVSQLGGVLPTGREHFGYADGFSQPAIEGSRFEDHPGAGAPASSGDWRPIRAGEFILGYPDEQGALARRPVARRLRPQRLLRRLPQAAPGRGDLPPPAARGGRALSRRRGAAGGQARRAAGATGRRSTPRPTPRTRRWRPTSRATTRSTTDATRTACAARSARTSAA